MKKLTQEEIQVIKDSGLFDAEWYASQYPDVGLLGADPLGHYLGVGTLLRRNPSPNFDTNYYMKHHDDVVADGMHPLLHYILFGKAEKRAARHIHLSNRDIFISLSIIIPTHNRAPQLPKLVKLVCESAKNLNYEVIIVDDGSNDQTRNVLNELILVYPNLKTLSIKNSGAGVARNHGCAIATKDVILFLGDDIIPANQDFFSSHAKYHQLNPELNFAVLGKVDWPRLDTFEITPVMRHITGPQGEQFGYEDMSINRCYDWRFFYTCNVSVKRNITKNWIDQGFSVNFTGCGWEDSEFAYRMEKRYGGFNIFYTEESYGHHFHRHDVTSFLRRQRFAGAMAKVIFDLHPELLSKIDFAECFNSLRNTRINNFNNIQKNLLIIDSLFNWAKFLEKKELLGSQYWHKFLFHSIFRISALLGFIEHASTADSNYAGALDYTIDSACDQLVSILPRSSWEKLGFIELAA